MSTHSPSLKETKITAKPSLDFYSTLEKNGSANTSKETKTQDAQKEKTLSLGDVYEKSKSTQSHESETLLYEHEEKQNLHTEEILKEKTKNKKQVKTQHRTEEKITPDDDHLTSPDHLMEINNSKKIIEKKLKELQSKKESAGKDQDSDNMEGFDTEIAAFKKSLHEIDILQKKLSSNKKNKNLIKAKHLSDGNSSDGESAGGSEDKEPELSPKSKSNLTNTIIKRTTTRPRSSADTDSSSIRPSAKSIRNTHGDIAKNVQDDIHQFSNIEDRKRIIKIDNKILNHSEFADKLLSKIVECKAKIENKEQTKNSHESSQSSDEEFPANRSTKLVELQKRLKHLEYDYTQLVCKLGRLFDERDNIGRAFLSPPVKELADTGHITQGISEETKKLEENYKKMLKEYTDKVNNDPAAEVNAAKCNLKAGAAAFGTSFFLTNTASRLLGLVPGVPPWVSTVFSPIIAGSLHTVVATPTAKQFMLRTWRSPVLAEMNNHFRLMGAYWHDKRQNKLHEKKYTSKDPNNQNLLTIEARLAEERNFSSIFSDRYHSEENPYFSYAGFYSLKGVLQTLAFHSIHPSTEAAIGIDTITHAVAGFISGAIYLEVQQSRRSQRPGNTVDVNPTSEIYQAQTEWLTSRRNDLKKMIAEIEAVDKNDLRLRELSIKLHKTEVALLTAAAKSGKFTAWLHDFKAQFKPEVLVDTLCDMVGRIVSLYPTAVVNHFCSGLRASANPFLAMIGYIIPAMLLIAIPGFQARGVYGGIIRACIQSMVGVGSAASKTEHHHSAPDEEDMSEIITLNDSDYETDSDEEDDKDTWTGRPLKHDEEMV